MVVMFSSVVLHPSPVHQKQYVCLLSERERERARDEMRVMELFGVVNIICGIKISLIYVLS